MLQITHFDLIGSDGCSQQKQVYLQSIPAGSHKIRILPSSYIAREKRSKSVFLGTQDGYFRLHG